MKQVTTINTGRLLLVPLAYEQLIQYYKEDPSLDIELGLAPTVRTITDDLKEALSVTIVPGVAAAGKDYLFSTLWSVILIAENRMVGDLCFIGPPGDDGIIEIGYGTYTPDQGNGYMSEAVGGIIGWARLQPGVQSIWAGTLDSNPASWRVLEKNDFVRHDQVEQIIRWKLEF